MKRIVIMADGAGQRWNSYMGIPKHFASVNGERVIERTIRLLNCMDRDFEIIVTSHDERYEFEGSRRYEPLNNIYEIDRFTDELIEDDMCFLYGDTYYTEESLELIMETGCRDVLFFGNSRTIVGVKIKDSGLFRSHVNRVRNLYLEGIISQCKGWQVYRSVTGQCFDCPVQAADRFVFVDEWTRDINSPNDYEVMKR